MAKQTINVGTTANDGTGDTLRDASQKINSNFTELYSQTTSSASDITTVFAQANTGVIIAQAAFDYANTIVSDTQIDPLARTTANAAILTANAALANTTGIFDGDLTVLGTISVNDILTVETSSPSASPSITGISTTNYNLGLQVRSNTWLLGADSTTRFPNDILQSPRDNDLIVRMNDGGQEPYFALERIDTTLDEYSSKITIDKGSVSIYSESANGANWIFGNVGGGQNIRLPYQMDTKIYKEGGGDLGIDLDGHVWTFGQDGKLTAPGEVYGQFYTIRGGDGPDTQIGNLGYGGNTVVLFGTEGVNIEAVGEGGPQWRFETDGNTTFPGNISFSNDYSYNGNTFTSPESNGILKNFKWNFSDTATGADTVTLQWNSLDTTFPQWYLSTDNQGTIYTFDGSAKTLGLYADNVNSGTLTFGTSANNGAGGSNDIELTTVTGDAYIRTNSNSWKFDNTGELTVPGFIHLEYSGVVQGSIGTGPAGFSLVGEEDKTFGILLAPAGSPPVEWTFNTDGSITYPDSSIQTGAAISLVDLKALVANSASWGDFQTAIAAL